MLKDFINALVMDSLTYGKKLRFTPSSSPSPKNPQGKFTGGGDENVQGASKFSFPNPPYFVLEAQQMKAFQAVTILSAKVVVKE